MPQDVNKTYKFRVKVDEMWLTRALVYIITIQFLGDVGDGGRLRYLHIKVDTTISCVCVRVLLAPPSFGAWSMTLVLWLPLKYYYDHSTQFKMQRYMYAQVLPRNTWSDCGVRCDEWREFRECQEVVAGD